MAFRHSYSWTTSATSTVEIREQCRLLITILRDSLESIEADIYIPDWQVQDVKVGESFALLDEQLKNIPEENRSALVIEKSSDAEVFRLVLDVFPYLTYASAKKRSVGMELTVYDRGSAVVIESASGQLRSQIESEDPRIQLRPLRGG